MQFLQSLLGELDEEEEEEVVNPTIRRIYERREPLTYFSDSEFKMRFRMDKESAISIVDSLRADLEYNSNRNRPISPENQFLLTLRFYASGAFFLEIADFLGVSRSSAHTLVHKVTRILLQYRHQWVKMPETPEELRAVQLGHYKIANFPKVLGLIDGTHIKIYSPGGERAEEFRNRKGVFSINVQCICNADLKIMDVVARWPGSAHDSTIFNSSRVKARIEMGHFGDCVLLGDGAYMLSSKMMTPLSNPASPEEILYNESHISTRNAAERTFGLWKRRFPIIGQVTQIKVENVQRIIVATIILHNILIELKDDEPPEDSDIHIDWDSDDDETGHNTQQTPGSANRRQALNVQRKFINYFRQFC